MSDLELELAYQIKVTKLPVPQREYVFHPTRKWRLDFAWLDRMVGCEVEGGTWVSGRHSRGKAFEEDCVKYAEAVIAGWSVLRVTTDMVTDGRALELLERLLAASDSTTEG